MFEEYHFISGCSSTWPMITKDTTIEELKFIHKKICDYVIAKGRKPQTPYLNNCVVCEYVAESATGCEHCPIVWPDTTHCSSENGLFTKWLLNWLENAMAIRDVEWKGEANG